MAGAMVAAPLSAASASPVIPQEASQEANFQELISTPMFADEAPAAFAADYPGGLNSAEVRYCAASAANTDRCWKAKGHADTALQAAQENFPSGSLHNGNGDAFRHCYWSGRMSIDMGRWVAKGFGDRHEDFPGNPANEKNMDLFNNGVGYSNAANAHNTYDLIFRLCKREADAGRLMTLS
jgi:hypothetical protein